MNITFGTATLGAITATNFTCGTKVGFFAGSSLQASAYTQTYSTATKTHSNMTSAAVTTTAATNVSPYGYTTQAQADAIVTAINALRNDVINLKGVVNSLIDDLQAYGLVL